MHHFPLCTQNRLLRKLRRARSQLYQRYGLEAFLYPRYWCLKVLYMLNRRLKRSDRSTAEGEVFIGALCNHGAGIGHQLANWVAAFHYAKVFEAKFVHFPLGSSRWEEKFGLGVGELKGLAFARVRADVSAVRVPWFREDDSAKVAEIGAVIGYAKSRGASFLFLLEQDQYYAKQACYADTLRSKFCRILNTDAVREDFGAQKMAEISVVAHVRRGDIAVNARHTNANLGMRWLDDGYYINALNSALGVIEGLGLASRVTLLTQGGDTSRISQGRTFIDGSNLDQYQCFDLMSQADVLITSRSSFSYKAALVSSAFVMAPDGFWHDYPRATTWVTLDPDGSLSREAVETLSVWISERSRAHVG